MVALHNNLKSLPITTQITTQNLAAKRISISEHLASAADYNAATSNRLAGIAHAKVMEIDGAKQLDEQGLERLKGIAILTRMSNDASSIGINLIKVSKDVQPGMSDPNQDIKNMTDEELKERLLYYEIES